MTFFEKTLDEIYDIVSEINDQIFEQTCPEDQFPKVQVTFEFSDTWALFKLNDDELFNSENNGLQWDDNLNDYEDLSGYLIKEINNKLDIYKKIELI